MLTRKRIAMIVAEVLGTALLTLTVLAVSRSNLGFPYFIGIAAGLVLVMATFVLGSVSGAHLNPIVTIGLWSIRKIKTVPALVYIAAQLLGGIAAYYLFTYFIGQPIEGGNTTFQAKILVAETVGALIFSLGWAATVYQRYEGGRAAATVGISLMLGILVASMGAAGILNPAVALGVQSWAWTTYVLGPVLGAIIGFNLYSLLFAPAAVLAADAAAEEKSAKKKK